jgi:mannose-1-phosphate guanylyltransferase
MRALLLSAGLGTRLRPLTETIPKCLVPIHGQPLIDYWLELIFAGGIERALINTHWLSDKVAHHIAESPWRDRIDLVFEPNLLGTGGTLRNNRSYFGAESLLIAHADNLTCFDLGHMLERHARRPSNCVMTMLAFRTDDPRSCGILELDSNDILRKFHEKVASPPGNLANGAVYIIEPTVADEVAAMSEDFIDFSTEIIPGLIGRTLVVETNAYHRDIGSLASLRQAETEFLPMIAGTFQDRLLNRRSNNFLRSEGALVTNEPTTNQESMA